MLVTPIANVVSFWVEVLRGIAEQDCRFDVGTAAFGCLPGKARFLTLATVRGR
jgi:hypothetical protein